MMKKPAFTTLVLTLLVVAMLLSSCISRDPLLGQWQEPNSGVTIELLNDGNMVMSLHGSSFKMSYQLEDPDVLIFLASEDGSIPEQRTTYKVSRETLTITLDGVDTVFLRVEN